MGQIWKNLKQYLQFKYLLLIFAQICVVAFIQLYFQTKVPLIIYGVLSIVAIVMSSIFIIQGRFIQAEPNEFLLLIENGKLIQAGVGIRVFKKFSQNMVKFNSNLTKINFSAHNVTKEWQGVKMSGFIMYSVYRDEEGPYQYYKYMQSYDAQDNIRVVCESIVRHHISNMSIEEIQKDRQLINKKIITDLKKEVQNWGIWVETVEITEANVMSVSLNNDLQVEFEQESQFKAKKMGIETQTQINENKMDNDLQLAKKQTEQEFAKMKTQQLQGVQRLKQEINLLKQQVDSQQKKLQQDKDANVANEKRQFDLQLTGQKQQQDQDTKTLDAKLAQDKEVIEFSKGISSLQMQKYIIEQALPLFHTIIKKIKVNQYNADYQAGNADNNIQNG